MLEVSRQNRRNLGKDLVQAVEESFREVRKRIVVDGGRKIRVRHSRRRREMIIQIR